MARILLIDHEPELAEALAAALRRADIGLSVHTDGVAGLEAARTLGPQAIVLGVELPGGSGYSVCNKLKKDAALSQIPLLLISREATEETFEQHRKLKTHAEGYLRKPFELGQLLALLATWLPQLADAAAERPAQSTTLDLALPPAPAAEPADAAGGIAIELDMDAPLAPEDIPGLSFDLAPAASAAPAPAPPPSAAPAPRAAPAPSAAPTPPAAAAPSAAPTPPAAAAPSAAPAPPAAAAPATPPPAAPAGAAAPPAPAGANALDRELADIEASLAVPRTSARRATEELVAASTTSRVNMQAAEADTRALRQKVKSLEDALQAQALEFHDRLLQEGNRGRDTVALKRRVSELERDLAALAGAKAGLLGELEALGQAHQALTARLAQEAAAAGAQAEQLAAVAEAHARLQAAQAEHQESRARAQAAVERARRLLTEASQVSVQQSD